MGVVQVRLPDEVQEIIRRQVEEGRAAGVDEYVAEAVRRYAEELDLEDDLEDELVAVARAGIADAEAGRYRTIATPDDSEAWHEEKMARLRAALAAKE